MESLRWVGLSLKAAVVASLLVLLAVTSAYAAAVSPAVRAMSVTASDRTDAFLNGPSSREVAISGDGRFVAFASLAPNLVKGDTNGQQDIFVRDRQLGVTTRVSMSYEGKQVASGLSSRPSISADGRFVAFTSSSSELVADDTNGMDDVFVHDRQSGTTIRVSVESDGSQRSGRSDYPSVSRDGRYVAFVSYVRVKPDPDSAFEYDKGDVYVRDTAVGTTVLVSKSSEGVQGNHGGGRPAISGNGRYVAFPSISSNLVPGGPPLGEASIFVHDMLTGVTTRDSVNDAGVQGPSPDEMADTTDCSLSDDGRFLAFMSTSTNLVPGDTNESADVFVRDRTLGKTTRVSVSTSGKQASKGGSYGPKLSADGRFVAFVSEATNLISYDTNKKVDIFLHDRSTGSTRRVSVTYHGAQANGTSGPRSHRGFTCDVSDSGRWVAFYSSASNLVPHDVNSSPDVFVRDMSATWKTRTFLTFTASPTTLKAYGDSAVLTGTLRKGSPTGTRFAGAKVAVQRYYSDGWRTIKTVKTSSTGRVSTTVTPSRNGIFRLRYNGFPGTYAAAESRKIGVSTKARMGTPKAKRISGREYRLSSAMRPRHTAGLTSLVRVYLAKYKNGRWVQQNVGTRGYLKAKVYDSGDYSAARATFTFPSAGRWRVRFVHLGYDCHMKSKSPYAYLTVK